MKQSEKNRLLRTLAHLQPSQLYWRTRYTLERRSKLRPAALARWQRPAGDVPAVTRDFPLVPVFDHPSPTSNLLDQLESGNFSHHYQTRAVGVDKPDWGLGVAREHRLWTVTLHYHAWAYSLAELCAEGGPHAARASRLLRHYLTRWMEDCALEKPGARHLVWNSHAVATRIIWWIRTYLRLGGNYFARDPEFAAAFLRSLWQQAAYLADHLEWDLLANHLLRDVAGLAWAGRFFQGPEADAWTARAAEVALEQISEQVLSDGGHFERSPMYHIEVMKDVLSFLLLLPGEECREAFSEAWLRMADYLTWMRHPDGGIPLFNDSALNGTCSPRMMLDAGASFGLFPNVAMPVGGRYFNRTGMVCWRGSRWALFFDVGHVGPDYQPGHAHADTLSIECSVNGQRLFVDPGTFHYDNDDRRRYDRRTWSHNTVCIDGADSSDVWHVFRVGRRAAPTHTGVMFPDINMQASSSHDGYSHLPGSPSHSRSIHLREHGALVITDRIEGEGHHRVEGGFLLSPQWHVSAEADGWLLSGASQKIRVTLKGTPAPKLQTQKRAYHPEFGVEQATARIGWLYDGPLPIEVSSVVEVA